MKRSLSAGLGLAVSILVYLSIGDWWLNSGRGVVAMTTALFVVSAIAAALLRQSWLRTAGAMAAGSVIGSTLVLIRTGPGTIWPIVLVFVACFSGTRLPPARWLARGCATDDQRIALLDSQRHGRVEPRRASAPAEGIDYADPSHENLS